MTARASAPPAAAASGRDFWVFFAGQTVSNLGSSFTFFAFPLLVYQLTGSPVSLGLGMAAWYAPFPLLGLLLGAVADRVDRKRLMVGCDVARAAVLASVPLLSWLDALSVGWLYAGAFLVSTLTIPFQSAEFAALPYLVGRERLVTANGRLQASYNAAQVAGPMLAAALVGAGLPVPDLLLADAVSFLLSAAALRAVTTGFGPEQRKRRHVLREAGEGLAFVFRHPVLRNLSLMIMLVNFFVSTTWGQIVLLAKERLAASDAQVGVLFAAGSAGVVVLGLAAGRLRRHLSFSRAVVGALIANGAVLVGLALARSYPVGLVLWAASSGLGVFVMINTMSLRQLITPPDLLGRVVAVAGVMAFSAIPVGTAVGGWAIEATSVQLVFALIGLASMAIAALFGLLTAVGRADRYLAAAPGEPAPLP